MAVVRISNPLAPPTDGNESERASGVSVADVLGALGENKLAGAT